MHRSLAALSLCLAPVAAAQTFQGLGFRINTISSGATSVSADGTVVTGRSGLTAFRWTSGGGFQNLGGLPGQFAASSTALAISGDGSTVVGSSGTFAGAIHAFRWSASTGMQDIGVLAGQTSSQGAAVNPDGSIIAGGDVGDPGVAFSWTGGTFTSLGLPPGSSNTRTSTATGMSADASIIVGYGMTDTGQFALRWTSATGMVSLGTLSGGTGSAARAISGDGLVIVGEANLSDTTSTAFRWTNGGGFVSLGMLPGQVTAVANGVSSNGAVIVGNSASASGQHPFVWTAQSGMLDLAAYLAAHAVDLSGWDLTGGAGATAISADGHTIVGQGTHNGAQEAWLVTIPTITPGCGSADFNHDGDTGTDADIEAFFACLSGNCCAACDSADFNGDGDTGTDADIESFFRVLSGGPC